MADPAPSTEQDTSSATRRAGLDRDDVIGAALALVADEGPAALTMRRLSVKLGVKSPTIYWHVGSRDDLVAEVIRAHSRRLAEMEVTGANARDRVFSAARNLWQSAIDHRAFTSLAHQSGMSVLLARPLEEHLVQEITAAGLPPGDVAAVTWAILAVVGGSLLLELRDLSSVPTEYQPRTLWAESSAPIDAEVRAAMQAAPDFDVVCATALRAVIYSRIPLGNEQ